jgi:hypothetical protein
MYTPSDETIEKLLDGFDTGTATFTGEELQVLLPYVLAWIRNSPSSAPVWQWLMQTYPGPTQSPNTLYHFSVGILDDLVADQPRGKAMLRALLQEIARLLQVRYVERCTATWLHTLFREAMEDET